MPLVARCHRCNYIVWALTRAILNIDMEEHDIESHRDWDTYNRKDYSLWHIFPISNLEYCMIQRMAKFPAFWNALRRSHKELASLFSGRHSGETEPFCNPTDVANGVRLPMGKR